ncbi:MAG: cupin domain-containing protein [Methylobacteriaceae bacterium]|nr:cupin domain-containing protein [Methylobacteriaceae bacterium]
MAPALARKAGKKSRRAAPQPVAEAAVGARVRALRRARGVKLDELARQMGVSIGYLSQIERGLSSPSLRVLVSLTQTLGAPIASLFSAPANGEAEAVVVRKARRGRLAVWKSGVRKQLLTPDGDSALSIFLVEIDRGGETGEELYAHSGEEAGLVLEGAMTLTVEAQTWRLGEGDSFRFRSTRPHRFANAAEGVTRVLWVNVAT